MKLQQVGWFPIQSSKSLLHLVRPHEIEIWIWFQFFFLGGGKFVCVFCWNKNDLYVWAESNPTFNFKWELSCTLGLKRNAPSIHQLALQPWVKVMWPWLGHICSWKFVTGHKRPHPKMSNGFSDILKSPSSCHVLEFVNPFKSHCNECKFGIFSKWCVSFGQECMVLNPGVSYNSAMFQVMF